MGFILAELHPKLKDTPYESRDTYFSNDEKLLAKGQFHHCKACFEHDVNFVIGRIEEVFDGPDEQLYVIIYVNERTETGAWIFAGICRGEFTGVSVHYDTLADRKTKYRHGIFLRNEISVVRTPAMRDSLILKYGFKPSQYITGAGKLTHFKPTNQNRRMEEINPTTTESNETKTAAHAAAAGLNYSPEDMAGYMEWKKNDAIKRARFMENTIGDVMAYVVSNRDTAAFQLPSAAHMQKITTKGGEDYEIYKIAASAIASQSQHQKEIERLTAERATLVKTQQEQAAAAAPTTATPESRRASLAPTASSLEALNAAIEASHAVVRKVYDANAPKLGGYLNDADSTKTFAAKVDAVFERMGVPKQTSA